MHKAKVLGIALICLIGIVTLESKKMRQSKHTSHPISIAFTGDVMIGRTVNKIIAKKGCLYIWGTMLEYLQNADLTIVNLETTLTKSNQAIPKVFNFKSDPHNVQCLVKAGIDVVTLANNHSLDFNVEGLQETIDILNAAKILHVGAGMNAAEARKPVITTIRGLRIGILGYTDNEPGWKAETDKPGVHYIQVGDIDIIKEDIKGIRNHVDILIATLHWGPNMRQRPTQEFINFAHAMIDAGIDIIHGHSAHILQGIEVYNNRLIMYDTGDFIDDYQVDPLLRNDQTCLFLVTVDQEGILEVRLVPALIEAMQVNKADKKTAQSILEHMKKLSLERGTHLDNDVIKIRGISQNFK